MTAGRGCLMVACAGVVGLVLGIVLIAAVLGAQASCGGAGSTSAPAVAAQPAVASSAASQIPANYLTLAQEAGRAYGVPWNVLAAIAQHESDFGRDQAPGVASGENFAGAAGPMQIGIGGAAGNTWGGAPVHPASERVGIAVDGDGDGVDNVYDPADALFSAAHYLQELGAATDLQTAVRRYNGSGPAAVAYAAAVMSIAHGYAAGTFTVTTATSTSSTGCSGAVSAAAAANLPAGTPQQVRAAIAYVIAQLGKPYAYGATGPGSFDCSGLMMMAYRAAGITIPRTSEAQWAAARRIPASEVQPGDLVFFVGSPVDSPPGHVGMVIDPATHTMIDAPYTGVDVRYDTITSVGGLVGYGRMYAGG